MTREPQFGNTYYRLIRIDSEVGNSSHRTGRTDLIVYNASLILSATRCVGIIKYFIYILEEDSLRYKPIGGASPAISFKRNCFFMANTYYSVRKVRPFFVKTW